MIVTLGFKIIKLKISKMDDELRKLTDPWRSKMEKIDSLTDNESSDKTKLIINYEFDEKELYDRTEKQLLKEGWEKVDWNEPSSILKGVKPRNNFFCIFERKSKEMIQEHNYFIGVDPKHKLKWWETLLKKTGFFNKIRPSSGSVYFKWKEDGSVEVIKHTPLNKNE